MRMAQLIKMVFYMVIYGLEGRVMCQWEVLILILKDTNSISYLIGRILLF